MLNLAAECWIGAHLPRRRDAGSAAAELFAQRHCGGVAFGSVSDRLGRWIGSHCRQYCAVLAVLRGCSCAVAAVCAAAAFSGGCWR